MEFFSNTELEDMHLIYGLEKENARATERLYCKRYLERESPDRQMFNNLHHRAHYVAIGTVSATRMTRTFTMKRIVFGIAQWNSNTIA